MDKKQIRREAERRREKQRTSGESDEVRRAYHDRETEDVLEELRVHQIELEIQKEELTRAQYQLEQSRQRYFRLYEFAPIGYITVRPDGRILSANLTICDMLGRDRDSVVRAGLFGIMHGGYHDAISELLRQVIAIPEECASTEARFAGENGAFVKIDALRSGEQDGVAYEIHLSITDISAEKHAEERAASAAEHNRLLLREFNHRVKNNLQMLLSLVALQRRRAPDPNTEAALAAVEDRVRTMSFAHQSLEPESAAGSADLVGLLGPLVRQIGGQTDAELTFSSSEDELPIAGDAALVLALAVNELISNSIKYAGGDPSITVRLQVDRTGREQGNELTLTISDTGPGLPERLLTRRGGDTPKPDTGLGFMLVSQLVEQQLEGMWFRRNHPEGGAEHEIRVVV
ncbi:MAG: sensor histidine kinase [Spirochaetota bacterium]